MDVNTRMRLYEEYDQLSDRVTKLQEFVDGPRIKVLPEQDRNDLRSQLVYMKAYRNVLRRRRDRAIKEWAEK